MPVVVPSMYDSGAFGAAMLGAAAAGHGTVKEIADKWVQIEERIEPDPENVKLYEKHYERYKRLDEDMQKHYVKI